jgi:hypothetical protein
MKHHTIWLLPAVFDRVWRDERSYIVCENIRALGRGDQLTIEEGDEDGKRSGRLMHARVMVVTRGGEEGLPRDLSVFEVAITLKKG